MTLTVHWYAHNFAGELPESSCQDTPALRGVLPRLQCQLSFSTCTAQLVTSASGQLICQTAFASFTLFLHAVLDVRPYAAHLCGVLS